MKKIVLFALSLSATASFGQVSDCSEIFISEYVEGWSNNKALEIFNPTGSPVNLNQYMVIRYSNGATTATAANAVQLSGTIAPNDVFVAVLEKLDPNGTQLEAPVWDSLQARADGYFCPVYLTSDAFYWNGDDAVVLAKGTTNNIAGAVAVDIFGKIGEDPGTGWTTAFPYTSGGVVVTADHSLIRKATVLKGETNPTISFFNALDQYDSIPAVVEIGGQTYGNWFSLGEHQCDCPTASVDETSEKATISIYPNPSNGEFFVKGDFTEVRVLNALGQEVVSVSNNTKPVATINLGDKRGVYIVKVRNGSTEITKRVIVK